MKKMKNEQAAMNDSPKKTKTNLKKTPQTAGGLSAFHCQSVLSNSELTVMKGKCSTSLGY